VADVDLAGDGGGDQGGAAFLEECNRALSLIYQALKLSDLFV
jgi:hypothetical protein